MRIDEYPINLTDKDNSHPINLNTNYIPPLAHQFFATAANSAVDTKYYTVDYMLSAPPQLSLQKQIIQARLKAKIAKALNEPREITNPVQALIDLFANMPSDKGTWHNIIEEPYG